MNLNQYLVSLSILVLCLSCASNNEEDLYGSTTCNTTDISYSQDLVPIIISQCFNCHDAANNNGNVTLEGYNNVITSVNNGRLLGSIRHDAGFAAMPLGKPKLIDCNIEKFEAWIDQGATNN